MVSVSPSAMRTTRPVSDVAGRRISLGFDAQGDAPSSVRPYDAADALGRAKSTESMRGQFPETGFEMVTFATFLARYGVCQGTTWQTPLCDARRLSLVEASLPTTLFSDHLL